MEWWEAILLGALQGVTEFLPISSSGHLVLAQHFLGFSEGKHGAAIFFDGVLHLGTAVAVLLYFRKGLREQVSLRFGQKVSDPNTWPSHKADLAYLAALVGLATLPAALVAIFFSKHIEDSFENPLMVAVSFLVLGAILLLTDRIRRGATVGPQTKLWQALTIGVAQAISAVFRGLSRSGMTISASLAVGLQRDWAVRFSFMMSVVASLGLGAMGIRKALQEAESAEWLTPEFVLLTILGGVVSAVVGYLTIHPLILLVRRCKLWWFTVYLWIVGTGVLVNQLWNR